MDFERRLSELVVSPGLGLEAGQEVLLTAHVDHLPLVREIAAALYRAGAVEVLTLLADDELTLARFRHGGEEAAGHAPAWLYRALAEEMSGGRLARVSVAGEDPGLFKEVPPEKLALATQAHARAYEPVLKQIASFATNWTIVPYPSRGWAAAVFPDLPGAEARERLKRALALALRLDAPDPAAEWRRRADELAARARWLSERRFRALHFLGPGTDLVVGLAEGHRWKGGWATTRAGKRILPNIPTEEVFTMPHRERVEGVASASMPFSLSGVLVRGLRVRFERGVAVEVEAEEGLEAVEALLATDEGARRLGEVALVPADSGVRRAGLLFLNTLLDENAASHIAFGQAYGENLEGFEELGEEERRSRGMNQSRVHQDWMIGSEEVDVFGVGDDGRRVPLLKGGRWAFQVGTGGPRP